MILKMQINILKNKKITSFVLNPVLSKLIVSHMLWIIEVLLLLNADMMK